ncbi:hypothetical protein TNCV_927031 [Trichonephila clavipes]|nr:hypothetical protein TNCV_927031 [Trichonephila clavipes]
MVDIGILMQIWKNRVRPIYFVLKWLIRIGSEVSPTRGKLEPWEGDEKTRERSLALDGEKGKNPALDRESMRGERWLERTGRER